MARVPLVFARRWLRVGEAAILRRVGAWHVPVDALRRRVEIDLGRVVICPEGDAPDDRVLLGRHGWTDEAPSRVEVAARTILEEVDPLHRHRQAPLVLRTATESRSHHAVDHIIVFKSLRSHPRVGDREAQTAVTIGLRRIEIDKMGRPLIPIRHQVRLRFSA